MPYRTFEMISLGPLHLRTWGLIVGLGILAGAYLAVRLAPSRGIQGDRLWTLTIVVTLAGVLGSRVLWSLQPDLIGETLANPLRLIAVWDGGLTFIGGLLAAAAAGVVYVRRAGLPVLATADVAAPGLALGIAIGRVGCFLTGLHPGQPTSLPWGIDYLGAVRHPIPLYESVLGLALLTASIILLRRRVAPGVTGVVVGLGYLIGRSLLDLLRAGAAEGISGTDPRLLGPLTLTQGATLVVVPVLVFLLVWILRWRVRNPLTQPSMNR
ncbi:MAG: prolipoprotein diacylglyceryl transferase [Thermoleophilia bacterium]